LPSDALQYAQASQKDRTRTGAYSLQSGARPIEVDSGGADPDDVMTTNARSMCAFYSLLACTEGKVKSLLTAQIRGLSALDVHNGCRDFPSTVPSFPKEVHRKGSIEQPSKIGCRWEIQCVLVIANLQQKRLQREGRQSRRHSVEIKSDWLFDQPRSNYWLRASASNLASQ